MKRANWMAGPLALLFWAGPGFAVDPAMRISQYAHTAWRMQDGVFGGAPHAITQTADGYIWVGTDAGLVRFDGVRFTPREPPDKRSAISAIYSLLGGRDGTLWIGSGSGLIALKNEHLIDFPKTRGRINHMVEDHAGTVWVARSRTGADYGGGLCQVVGDQLRCFGNSDGMSLPNADPLVEDGLGNLWIGTSGQLLRWSPKSWDTYFRKELKPYAGLSGIGAVAVAQDQSIWVGFTKRPLGLRRVVGAVSQKVVLPGLDTSRLNVQALFVDRHNSLWIGTGDDGLYRVSGSKVDHFVKEDGLTGNSVECIYGDAEENLWVVTAKGLDIFRDTKVATFSTREGLSGDQVQSVLARRDGSIWIGNLDSIDVLRGGDVTSIRARDGLPGHRVTSLFEDHANRMWVGVDRTLSIYKHGRFQSVPGIDGRPLGIVTAISEDTDRNIWITSYVDPAPRVFRIAHDRVVQEFSETEIPPVKVVAADPHGGAWFAPGNGSLVRYRAGKFEIVAKDLSPRGATFLAIDPDGSIWATTRTGLFRWSQGVVKRLGVTNGLPCESIAAVVKADDGNLWLYSKCGLVSIAASEIERWWLHPESIIRTRTFDALDGALPNTSTFSPEASKSPDGTLWFSNDTTLQSIDPRHLNDNRLVPPVHIEQVIADGKTYSAGQALRLPARTRDIEIDYTALSFRVPQKIRFRYRLEGRSMEWKDAGIRRQASFSDLKPGSYTFHVIASNNDGVWNDTGASWAFSIAPTFYQTLWFQAMMASAGIGLIWLMYRLRVQQVTARADLRYSERLEERTRIARELHDTMLQSLQASLAQMQASRNLFSRRPERALENLDRAITMAAGAIAEGRNAVGDLRSSTVDRSLAEALKALGEELTAAGEATFQLVVEGPPRDLHPMLQDEILRIGCEALRNAFRHARAHHIEVNLRYSEQLLRLQIRDDGVGIGPEILEGGRGNHYGLRGMRERAETIGAKLEIWSAAGTGTEIDLSSPAANAYRTSSPRAASRRTKNSPSPP